MARLASLLAPALFVTACSGAPKLPVAPAPGAPAPPRVQPAAAVGEATAAASAAGAAVSASAMAAAGNAQERAFDALYAGYVEQRAAAERAYALAWWDAANSGKKDDFARSAAGELALRKLHSDPKIYERLAELRASGAIQDPLRRRVLEVVYLSFKENQIQPELMKSLVDGASALEEAFNTFRAEVDGKVVTANEIRTLLATSDDSELRRKHWEASKAIGPRIAAQALALVAKRNEAARSLGFANYYEMVLELGEQSPAEIAAIFEELDRITAEPFQRAKAELDERLARRFDVAVTELAPWHYADVFFQESPGVEGLDLDATFAALDPKEVAQRYFGGLGLPVVESILARSDLYERPGKVEHAFCTHIDRKGDVRVLCNLQNDERWMGTLLHELGHGVYDASLDFSLPYVLRAPAHSFVTEGIAELFGTLTRNPLWLATYTQLDAAQRERVATLAGQDARLDHLIFARWSLVMVNFEREMYAKPDQDLEALWWSLVQRYQGLTPPASLAGRADWATKIHVVTVPAYYHNYVLGRMFAAQMAETLRKRFPAATVDGKLRLAESPEIGQFLVEHVFRPGLGLRWDALVRAATGEPLSAKAYAASLQ